MVLRTEEGNHGVASQPEVEVNRGVDTSDKQVRVWSTVGVKVPVPGLEYTMVEFSFGHERWAKASTQEAIADAGRMVEEFNSTYLDKHLRKLLRDIRRIDSKVSHESGVSSAKKKKGKKDSSGSVQDRVRARMGK